MRSFNLRFAIVLFMVTILIGAGTYFLHRYQVQNNARVFYDEAEQECQRAIKASKEHKAREKEEAEKNAVRYLTWYLRLAPSDLNALEKLALMIADQAQEGEIVISPKKFFEAYSLLEGLVRRDPERRTARKRLVGMAMRAGRFRDAKEHLQELLKKSPEDAALLEQLGRCEIGLSEYEQAQKAFKLAIKYDPTRFAAYRHMAVLLRRHFDKAQEADEWMQKLVEANPKAYQAYLQRADYLLAFTDRGDGAPEDVAKALELAPNNIEVLELAATCALANQKFDEALQHAKHAITIDPTHASVYALAARGEMVSGDRAKAVATLRQGLKATDGNTNLWLDVVDFLIDSNRLNEAKEAVTEFQASSSCPEFIKRRHLEYLNSRLLFAQGKWKAACEGFEAARKSPYLTVERLKPLDIWLGQCYGQLGNFAEEELAYRHALKLDPRCLPAQTALINLLTKKGQVDDALDQYRRMNVHERAGSGTVLPMVILLFQKVIQQPPGQRDWASIEKALDEAEAATPGVPEIPQLRAEMLVMQDRMPEAKKVLEEATAKNPTKAEFWLGLGSVAALQKDWETAETALSKAERLLGDTVAVRLTRAHYLARRYGNEAKDAIRQLTLNVGALTDRQRMNLWIGLMEQSTDPELTAWLTQKVVEKQPNNLQVRGMSLIAAIRAEDQSRIAEILAEIQRIGGGNSYWYQYGQGVLLGMQGPSSKNPTEAYQQALAFLTKARAARPNWPPIAIAEATIYERLGNAQMAIKRYNEAIDQGERNQAIVRRLLQLLLQTQQYTAAHELFWKLEKELGPVSLHLARLAGEAALQQQDFDRAAPLIANVSASNPNDYRVQLWLGRAQTILANHAKSQRKEADAAKQLGEAEKALRRAVELGPSAPEAWITLVAFLDQIGQAQMVEKVLSEAATKLPPETAAITIAHCYEAIQKPALAQQRYEEALAVKPDDIAVILAAATCYSRNGKLDKSEQLLTRALNSKLPLKSDEWLAARRQLAAVYQAVGGYQNVEKATKLLVENLAVAKNSALDLRLKAQLDARHPTRARRAEAIKILEQLYADNAATPEDRFLLAKLQVEAGNWGRANELFRKLVGEYDKEPRYLIAYIVVLLNHEALSDADMFLRRLQTIAPDSRTTVSLYVDLLCAMNEPQAALGELKKYIQAADRKSPEYEARTRFTAEKLDQLTRELKKPGQKQAVQMFAKYAEVMYRDFAKKSAADKLIYAAFLGRQGRLPEALSILERYAPECKPNDVLQACAKVLETERADSQQLQVLDRVLENTIQKSRTVPLLHTLADLRTYEGRTADAEALYREIIEKDGTIPSAWNNLAVLLALQGIKLEEALKLVNRAIELAGPSGHLLDSRATVYLALRDSEKALNDITTALNDEETAVRLFHKAQILAIPGANDASRAALVAAREKGLTAEMLHPLELPAFQKMLAAPR